MSPAPAVHGGRPIASFKNPWAWCVVGAGMVVYTVLSDVLVAWWIRLESLIPWGLTLLLPPMVYGILMVLCFRELPWGRWLAAAAGLWAVHLILGMTIVAFIALLDGHYFMSNSPAFPPPPVPQILWVPLLLIPLRDLVTMRQTPGPRGRAAGKSGRARPAAPAATPAPAPSAAGEALLPATPAPSPAPGAAPSAPATASPSPRPGGRLVRSGTVPAPAAERPTSVLLRPTPAPAQAPAEPAPSAAQRVLDQMLSEDPDAQNLRIPFERVAGQFPAELFRVSHTEVAAALREPGLLLVPQRLALLQLGEGVVRIGWEVVSGQFPRDLLAAGDEGVRRRLPDGQILLPLDEVVRQMPEELFAAAPAPVEPEALAGIPDIFRADASAAAAPRPAPAPLSGGPEAPSSAPPAARAGASGPAVPASERPGPAPSGDVSGPPAAALSATVESPAPVAVPAARRDERPVVAPLPPVELAAPAPARAPSGPGGEAGAQLMDTRSGSEALGDGAPLPEELPHRTAAHLDASEEGPIASLQGIAERLSPLVPLDMASTEVDGIRLLTLQSPVVDPYLAVTAAHAFVPLVADPRAPWALEQVTLRGPHAAVILTPLRGTGAGLLAAAVPRCGSLALLELVCRRQARCGDLRAADPAAVDVDRDLDPELIEVEPSTRVRRMASSLDAVGQVRASALRDPEGQHALYLFLPDGSDVRGAGGLATEVARALRRVGPPGTFDTVILRSGRQHMVIRLAGADDNAVVAAAGETRAPGLAHRQVAEVAGALAAS